MEDRGREGQGKTEECMKMIEERKRKKIKGERRRIVWKTRTKYEEEEEERRRN